MIPAIIGAVGTLAGVGANLYSNYKNRQQTDLTNQMNYGQAIKFRADNWQREDDVYNRERADMLADWQMVNDYNSPKAQMERYKEAGLNPNLMYGSSGDNSAANMSNPSIDPSSGQAPTNQAARFDTNGILQMMATMSSFVQNNERLQMTKEQQEFDNMIKAADLQLRMDRDLRDSERHGFWKLTTPLLEEYQKLQNSHLEAQTDKIKIEKDLIKQNTENAKVTFDNLKKDGVLKDEQINKLKKEVELLGIKVEIENKVNEKWYEVYESSKIKGDLENAGLKLTNEGLEINNKHLDEFLRSRNANQHLDSLIKKIEHDMLEKQNEWLNTSKVAEVLRPVIEILKLFKGNSK